MKILVLDAAVLAAVTENVMILIKTARNEEGKRVLVDLLVPRVPFPPTASADVNAVGGDMRPQIAAVEAAICGMVQSLTGRPAIGGDDAGPNALGHMVRPMPQGYSE
jgi:hypothetical protein